MESNVIEIALQHGCSPLNLLHIFKIHLPKSTSEWLLLGDFLKVVLKNFVKFTGTLFLNQVPCIRLN